MRTRTTLLAATIAITLIDLIACNPVAINTNDQTVPSVEIKVKDQNTGQYTAASTASMSASQAGTLDMMCVATDPDGIQSASLTFTGAVETCTVGEDTSSKASYSYQPVPQNLFQSLSGNNGKVIPELPLLATVKGPFTCTFPGKPPGVPFGTTIKATCHGENWSSNAAKKAADTMLTISLK